MKSRALPIFAVIAGICGIGFVALYALGVLGIPTSSSSDRKKYPDVTKQGWASAEIDYWYLNRERERVPRVCEVSDSEVLRSAFRKLAPYETESAYFRARDQLRLTTTEGAQWEVGIVFQNRIDFTEIIVGDADRGVHHQFHLYPDTAAFFNAVKNLCLKDLQATFPAATLDHVILRSNLADTHRPSIQDSVAPPN